MVQKKKNKVRGKINFDSDEDEKVRSLADCKFWCVRHFNIRTLDTRFRVQQQMLITTFIQFVLQLVSSIVALAYVVTYYKKEKDNICEAAPSYFEHYNTTVRKDFSLRFEIVYIAFIVYFSIDIFRSILILIYTIAGTFLGLIHSVLCINEILLFLTLLATTIFRHIFPGRLCSGEYDIFYYDATLQERGKFLWYIIIVGWCYQFLFLWLIHFLLTYIAAKDEAL